MFYVNVSIRNTGMNFFVRQVAGQGCQDTVLYAYSLVQKHPNKDKLHNDSLSS
jgi:hypothetical protein